MADQKPIELPAVPVHKIEVNAAASDLFPVEALRSGVFKTVPFSELVAGDVVRWPNFDGVHRVDYVGRTPHTHYAAISPLTGGAAGNIEG